MSFKQSETDPHILFRLQMAKLENGNIMKLLKLNLVLSIVRDVDWFPLCHLLNERKCELSERVINLIHWTGFADAGREEFNEEERWCYFEIVGTPGIRVFSWTHQIWCLLKNKWDSQSMLSFLYKVLGITLPLVWSSRSA